MSQKAFRAFKLENGDFHILGANGDSLTTSSLPAATHFSEYLSRLHSSLQPNDPPRPKETPASETRGSHGAARNQGIPGGPGIAPAPFFAVGCSPGA